MVVSFAQISAKKGDGVDELLETVLLMAEVEELQANPTRPARGTIVESHLDKRTGAIATMLVAAGTLRTGDVVQAGAAYGKVLISSSPSSSSLHRPPGCLDCRRLTQSHDAHHCQCPLPGGQHTIRDPLGKMLDLSLCSSLGR